jgi:MFS family permease
MLPRARLLIATLWVGALWTVGFIVAPTLFATLADRALAGTIGASLFRIVAWLSLACAAALIVLLLREERRGVRPLFYLIAGMVVCTVAGYFGLQPTMASLRELMHAGATIDAEQLAQARRHFGILHAVSTGFYVMQSVLGAALILKMR